MNFATTHFPNGSVDLFALFNAPAPAVCGEAVRLDAECADTGSKFAPHNMVDAPGACFYLGHVTEGRGHYIFDPLCTT